MVPDLEDDSSENVACVLEMFTEYKEVLEMIQTLPQTYKNHLELNAQKFKDILKLYQEQPHLLDKNIEELLNLLMQYVLDKNAEDDLKHAAFKYMYIISNVRNHKVTVRYLTHEITDMETILQMLEAQKLDDLTNWETRYMLLLWLSILAMNPFHMSRLDSTITSDKLTVMERIFNICKQYSLAGDSCCAAAAYLSSKFLTRNDVKDKYLAQFFDWACQVNENLTVDVKYGILASVAAILKHGKREDLLPYSNKLLHWIINSQYKETNGALVHKYSIKIIQRIGLTLLMPTIAAWRYQRGSRSLSANLCAGDQPVKSLPLVQTVATTETSEDIHVPEQIEDVLEELLLGLRNCDGVARWSAAKGVGRVTNRLPRELADEVLSSVLEVFSVRETHHAWHGGCLALAELAKKGLLLPARLPEIVPLMLQALRYDVVQGFVSVGAHIRDAACYVAWAFARAYESAELAPFVNSVAAALVCTAAFDREINVRRAASAAFQENVGRLGTFPHGIDILTAADFYSVGVRTTAYLEISVHIAQYGEYAVPLVSHLVELKVDHWDSAIRELCAKALHKLTFKTPEYMSSKVLPELFRKTETINVNSRHGAILAIGEVIYAFSIIAAQEGKALEDLVASDIIIKAGNVVDTVRRREQFKGLGGELMKLACSDLIEKLSKAEVKYNREITDDWLRQIEDCLNHKVPAIRQRACGALAEMLKCYYSSTTDEAILEHRQQMIVRFTNQLRADNETSRMGYAFAIGSFPKVCLIGNLNAILVALIRCAKIDSQIMWAESRTAAVKAIISVCETVGAEALGDYVEPVFECFMRSLGEYTIHTRGDIGAWVREAAMAGLHSLVLLLKETPHLTPEMVKSVMLGLSQQAVEKIERTRALAGKLFANLVHNCPYVPDYERVGTIFTADCTDQILWLFGQHTFPKFCELLALPEYSESVMLGIITSIGDLTETLMKHSSAALFAFLKSQTDKPEELSRLGKVIVRVFAQNQNVERVSCAMLVFLDLLLSSGSFSKVFNDDAEFSTQILALSRSEIKGSKKIYKILASINVFCQLIQFESVRRKALIQISVLLGHSVMHVRKTTATKFYEALIIHSDCLDIPGDDLDEVMTYLSEGNWDGSVQEVRTMRNDVCKLLGVPPPITPGSSQNK
ncbi:tubulin-specific chaperone D [Ctenocephalides felis]|uniref:tubulin-specific chaperone D n=1 Tax=Ctenocephalides felis TaxID=7515 RepID=UPI000E6E40B8|nr:tubulin-specific chaperone D [Ctenocephalides felis]